MREKPRRHSSHISPLPIATILIPILSACLNATRESRERIQMEIIRIGGADELADGVLNGAEV